NLMSHPRPIPRRVAMLIQRVADGAASPRDLARFERLVEGNPDLMDELERMQQLSSVLQTELRAASTDVDFSAMQAAVLRAVDVPRAGQPSFWERVQVWVRETLAHQPGLWAPLAACTAAVVLGLLVPAVVREPSTLPPELAAGRHTEIHSLDTEATTAMVFETPASGLTVIWLAGTDEEDEEEVEAEEAVVEDSVETPEEVEAEVTEDSETVTQ
ncbi:MAG: hypothetical protein AB2A00_36945, partial [Myxococcota bacterium]